MDEQHADSTVLSFIGRAKETIDATAADAVAEDGDTTPDGAEVAEV